MIRELSACPEISWLTLLDGDFDLEFVIWADNILEFEAVYDRILSKFGRYFQEKYFSIGTRVEYLPFRFLDPDQHSGASLIFGGAYERRRLDELTKASCSKPIITDVSRTRPWLPRPVFPFPPPGIGCRN